MSMSKLSVKKIKITIFTNLYLLASSNSKALIVAFDEVHVIPSPVEDLEFGCKSE